MQCMRCLPGFFGDCWYLNDWLKSFYGEDIPNISEGTSRLDMRAIEINMNPNNIHDFHLLVHQSGIDELCFCGKIEQNINFIYLRWSVTLTSLRRLRWVVSFKSIVALAIFYRMTSRFVNLTSMAGQYVLKHDNTGFLIISNISPLIIFNHIDPFVSLHQSSRKKSWCTLLR